MDFDLDEALSVLDRTPATLSTLLVGLSPHWVCGTEGEGTWSPFDVIGHLIHGERTDWLRRARHILSGDPGPFDLFDRHAQFVQSRDKTLGQLLNVFSELRAANLAELRAMRLSPADLEREGRHPELGTVTLRQLLATWVVHDLDHLAQIARVMAKAYGAEVGPWRAYLSILGDRQR